MATKKKTFLDSEKTEQYAWFDQFRSGEGRALVDAMDESQTIKLAVEYRKLKQAIIAKETVKYLLSLNNENVGVTEVELVGPNSRRASASPSRFEVRTGTKELVQFLNLTALQIEIEDQVHGHSLDEDESIGNALMANAYTSIAALASIEHDQPIIIINGSKYSISKKNLRLAVARSGVLVSAKTEDSKPTVRLAPDALLSKMVKADTEVLAPQLERTVEAFKACGVTDFLKQLEEIAQAKQDAKDERDRKAQEAADNAEESEAPEEAPEEIQESKFDKTSVYFLAPNGGQVEIRCTNETLEYLKQNGISVEQLAAAEITSII